MKNIMILVALFIVSISHSQTTDQNSTDPSSSVVNTEEVSSSDFDLFLVNTIRSTGTEVDEVTDGTLFSLNDLALQELRSSAPANFTLEIPIEHGENLILDLYQVEIFSSDFIAESTGGEDLSDVDYGLHYRGSIHGVKKSSVAISVFADQIRGIVIDNADNYTLGPIELGSSDYIFYKSADLNDDIKSQLNYSCSSTETETDVYAEDEINFAEKGLGDIVEIYIEVDKSIYDRQGSSVSAAITYTTSVFNQSAAIYSAEGIVTVASQIKIWSTIDPYDGVNGCSSDVRDEYLCDFQAQFNGFNGDLAILLIDANIGGVAAGFSGLCNANPDNSMCISGQSGTTVNTFPTYSYNTYIFAHELGHLFGSRHTHACVWNGNNTAIDGCAGSTEGSCALPPNPAPGSATIMSYCQTELAGGYIANAPFGSQPGNVIRASVAGASCIGCASPDIYIPNTVSAGPALYRCPGDNIPAGYSKAVSQSCAQSVVDADPFCLGAFGGVWDGICQADYDDCIATCTIYVPSASTSGPAVYVCPGETVPSGYYAPADQACVQ